MKQPIVDLKLLSAFDSPSVQLRVALVTDPVAWTCAKSRGLGQERREGPRLEAEGAHERAQFWFLMLVVLADIHSGRIDPEGCITIH